MVFFFLPAFGVSAQETAILKRGPVEIRGIDPLPRNAHQAYYGEYTYRDSLIETYVTYTEVYLPEGGAVEDCSVYDLYFLPSEADRTAVIYQDPAGWTLVARFSDDLDYCPFLTELIRKLVYFQGVSGGTKDFSFPAVLELPG